MKAILTILAFVIYSGFISHWYVCGVKDAYCIGQKKEQMAESEEEAKPLAFKYGEAEIILDEEAFKTFRDSQLSKMTEDNILEIEGMYYTGEADTLGDARAEAIKALFVDTVPEDRISIGSRKVNKEVSRDQPFEASELFWISAKIAANETAAKGAESEEADTTEEGAGDEEAEVKETIVRLPDRILIYHYFGSAKRTVDPQVDNYLDRLSQRLSQTDEKVSLTGHTDNVGEEESNVKLGLERAQYIKNILVQKGVDPSRISTATKGETQPIESNETDAGRAKNRRTELLLVK